ncbi:MAG: hypothetical protein AB7R55_10060 [Gemmatimonadales bacterium]
MAAPLIRLAALTLLGTAIATTATAQQAADPELRPGATVRVTTSTRSAPLVGTLVRAEPGRLTIRTGSAETLVDPRSVLRLERRTVRRHTGTGALVGAAVGGATAVAFAIGFCDDPDTLCEADEYARIGLIFVTPPLLGGALIGSLIKTERWRAVSVTPYLALHDGRGLGLRLRLTF